MDYFSASERPFQIRFAQWRDKSLQPFTHYCARRKIHPNFFSVCGIVSLVLTAIFYAQWWYAGIFILLYIFFDGIDGPVARAQGKHHPGGALVDIVVDQLGIIVIPLAAIHHLQLDGRIALLFSCSYIISIALMLMTNALTIESRWPFFRVKYVVYALYIYSLISNQATFLSVFLSVAILYYFAQIYGKLTAIYTYYTKKSS